MEVVHNIFERLRDQTWELNEDLLMKMLTEMVLPQIEKMNVLSDLEKAVLVEKVIRRYNESITKLDTPVGMNATLTVGENMSQESLQSHHKAGIKKGNQGFDRLKEIVELTTTNNIIKIVTTSTTIVYPDGTIREIPKTKEKIFDVANSLEKITIYDIITHYEIIDNEGNPFPSWYETFSRVFEKIMPTGNRWLRFHLDPEKIFRYRVNIGDLVTKLDKFQLYFPPVKEGLYIDAHPVNDDEIHELIPTVLSMIVSGLQDIISISIIPENMLSLSEVVRSGSDGQYRIRHRGPIFTPPSFWDYLLRMMIPGIESIRVNELERTIDFVSRNNFDQVNEWIKGTPLYYRDLVDAKFARVETREGMYSIDFDLNSIARRFPYLLYGNLVNRTFTSNKDLDIFLARNIVDFHYFWYIEAQISSKSKLVQIYINPDVDVKRTFVTTPTNMVDTLGHLAARQLIFNELSTNIPVDPVHMALFTAAMTRTDKLTPFTKNGFSNVPVEWMTSSNFEEVMKYTTGSAFVGSKDHLKSIASRILTGQRVKTVNEKDTFMILRSKDNPTANRYIYYKNKASVRA